MERVASLRLLGRGSRVLGLAVVLVLASCGGGGGGTGEGGSGGQVGGHGGTATGGMGTGGHGTGGMVSSTGGMAGGTAGSAGSTAGASGTAGGSAGMDGGADAASDAATDGPTDGPTDAGADAGNDGMACTANTECTSNLCVDGVCCESACAGSCMACSNAKTGQADGLCRPVKAATDPDDECAAQDQSTCGLDGVCDGAGACRKWAVGTTCVPESCSGSTDTPARTCDGMGTCLTVNNRSCGAYVCGATACKASCSGTTDCTLGNNCINGHCTPPQQPGAACTVATDCVSGNCVDGVCCDTACAGSCMACTHAKTGQADGTCAAIPAGTDPDQECAADVASGCGQDGSCNGAGACELWAAGTTCADPLCAAGAETTARICDGAGTCLAPTTTSCGAYMCGATACDTGCTTNADCVTGYFCSAGSCVALEPIGTACAANTDCGSGFCVDGVCCNTACDGTCQTCDLAGSVGTCTAAAAGSDPHSDCDAAAPSTCGDDGTCDGAGACRKYAAGTACGTSSCASAMVTASACDGAGTCAAGTPVSCNAYQCNQAGTACATACTSDASCNGFCSAAACVASPVNLAGNGDAEYGTTLGWTTNGGNTLVVESASTSSVHGGAYSIADTMLDANYEGPGYFMPIGAGKYNVSAWAMENDNPTQTVALQVVLNCGNPGAAAYPTIGTYGVQLTQGVWTQITGTIDFSASTGCDPATGGVVNSAFLYLNQTKTGTPVALPSLFLDDVSITATDGHNLIGNPNFEAGTASGWQNNGGGTLAVSTTQYKSGTHGLGLTSRKATSNGQRWNLPTGAGPAKYNVTFNALHTGTTTHTLMITPVYTCVGDTSATYGAAVASAASVAANTWTALTGTVTFPPADAPAGCKLASAGLYLQQGETGTCGTAAGQVECPDLFIDDASITLAP